jgi:hypothetical protein
VRVPETLWSGTDVAGLAGVDLPGHWVLKPNHSCIRRLFGRGSADVADLHERTAGWVEERYWRRSEEWAYRRARPGLLVEEFIGVPGVVPADLKVLVVDGEPRLVSCTPAGTTTTAFASTTPTGARCPGRSATAPARTPPRPSGWTTC